MKHRIPTDVERLMWLVAESNDPSAVADFESRFPDFAGELARRRRMVSDLKGAKTTHSVESRIPAFTPRPTPPSPPSAGTWAVAGLVLATFAVASYSITKWVTTPPLAPVKPQAVQTAPPVTDNTTVYRPPAPQPRQPTHVESPPTSAGPSPQQNNVEQPKTLKLSNTSLVAALKMIGEMAGYRVEVAPGLEDQLVSIDYEGFTTSNMLKDMGQRFGFTPFDQGDGTIIIVPAVDSGGMTPDTNGSQRRIGG